MATTTSTMDPHQRQNLRMNTMNHHHDHREDDNDHRRAEAFLSNWIQQNSFHTDCSSHNLNKQVDDDNDEHGKLLGKSLRSSFSSINLMKFDYQYKQEDVVNGEEDGKEDDDEFDASDIGLRFSLKRSFSADPVRSRSSSSTSLNYDKQQQPQQQPQQQQLHLHNHELAEGYRRATADYPPISDDLAKVYQQEEDDNANNYSASCSALRQSLELRSFHTLGSFHSLDEQGSSSNHAAITQRTNLRRMKSADANTPAQTSTPTDAVVDNDNKIEPKRQVVRRLPWRDHRCELGKYTGQVNDKKQPHGSGALIYKDGSAKTSIWKDGTPVRFWIPGEVKKKMKQQQQKQQQQISIDSKNSTAGNHCSKLMMMGGVSTNTATVTSKGVDDHSTFLPHLDLGDVGTSRDMIQFEYGPSIASKIMNSLRVHDFAFIQRSDGRWTYAIIADKEEDYIRFVVDANGDTKRLSKKHWCSSIRWVNPDEACCDSERNKNVVGIGSTTMNKEVLRDGISIKESRDLFRGTRDLYEF